MMSFFEFLFWRKSFFGFISFLFFVWSSIFLIGTKSQLNLPLHGIEKWAEVFGQTIYDLCAKATALADVRTDYLLMDPKVRPIDGLSLVKEMKEKMEKMLNRKIQAIQKLVEVAERSHYNHVYDKEIEITYHMSKKLNTTEFELEENEHFNDIAVNLSMSTVHVPTNVYDKSSAVLNGVAWSESLDETFVKNFAEDPTLTWQYFCSATGFLRNYPGTVWRTETYSGDKTIDVFDCRVRGWYIQAAAYPKDVVILLDSSGSMKGLRIEIAKATVEKILDTLSDDDFFNVIKYSDTIEYVDFCFNATMVQATEGNKERVKSSLSATITQNIANLDEALVEAFEILLSTNASGRGAQCNKAIMIITDGVAETYENIFAKYNWPRMEVRIFTYLIGREVGDSRNVRWMACRNKGRFSHIASLADVHEHVQSYVHVLSRPMVINRSSHPIWTNVYVDTLVPGLELMTTIAQPVFDTKNDTINSGVLLGVIGTDVPLKELIKLTPQYKLGVNGYSFAITNNGYALFHPRFQPPQLNDKQIYRRNSYAIDLSEIELLDVDMKLKKKMIERETDYLKLKSIIPFDEFRRAIVRTNNFYFTDIKGTPFSLAIVLPDGYGMGFIEPTKTLQTADLSALRSSDLHIAPWNYCKMETNESKQHPLEMFIRYLTLGKEKYDLFYAERCDEELINHLLFDAEATRGALASWMKENHDGTLNDSTSKRNGVEIVFIGTKGGLTRYFQLTGNLTDPDFIGNNNSTIDELYYSRAVENGESVFTFSIPFNTEKINMNSSVLTVSTPIIISENDREAVAAVVGLQLKYHKFYDIFINITRSCLVDGMNCNHTCETEEINCYLLDNNGYVILSENPKEVGLFFGELESNGALMNELIMTNNDEIGRDKGLNKGIFERIEMMDYQAMCDIYNTVDLGASSIFIGPLANLFSFAKRFINEIILFFLQFSLLEWWNNLVLGFQSTDGMTSSYDDVIPSSTYIATDYSQYYDDLNMSDKVIHEQMLECVNKMNDGGPQSQDKKKKFLECVDTVRQKSVPRVIGRRQCIKMHTYYAADPMQLPKSGTITRCNQSEECSNNYSVNRVPGTNLLLVVVDALCACANDLPVSVQPIEKEYSDEYICQKLQTEMFRKRPEQCHAYHTRENFTDCGLCSLTRPSSHVTIFLSLAPSFYFYFH